MNSLQSLYVIEKERNISLPEIYKQFYMDCITNRPKDLIGTDLINDDVNLNIYASQLVADCEVENFLTSTSFVFMMHQGYIFWYFEANGDPDPKVFGFSEVNSARGWFGRLTEFLRTMN